METVFEQFNPVVQKYLKRPNHEIEFRLGKVTRNRFDTNVGPDTYMKALRRLSKYTGWESVKVTNDVLYYGTNGRRATCNQETDEITRVIKKKVETKDFQLKDQPFDVRLGISEEKTYDPDEEEEEFEKTKHRVRHSFVRKNLTIDVSMVRGDPDDMDAENADVYQIELEIQDPSSVESEVQLKNIMQKIFDVLFIL